MMIHQLWRRHQVHLSITYHLADFDFLNCPQPRKFQGLFICWETFLVLKLNTYHLECGLKFENQTAVGPKIDHCITLAKISSGL